MSIEYNFESSKSFFIIFNYMTSNAPVFYEIRKDFPCEKSKLSYIFISINYFFNVQRDAVTALSANKLV